MQRLLLLKKHLGGRGKRAGGIWSGFGELSSTITHKPPLAGVLPSRLRFWEAPEDKAGMNGHGSSGTILRNKIKELLAVPGGEQCQSGAQKRRLTEFSMKREAP